MNAIIVTQWIAGPRGELVPAATADFGVTRWQDVTGQDAPRAGGVVIIEAELPRAEIVAMETDGDYGLGAVLSREDRRQARAARESPTGAEFTALSEHLAKLGLKSEELKSAVGETVDKRSRAQIAEQLTEWLRREDGTTRLPAAGR